MADIENITTRTQLARFRDKHGLRPDWHEPDEQEVNATPFNGVFDNAFMTPPNIPNDVLPVSMMRGQGEEAGVFLSVEGKRVAYVNLAVLFALASGCEEVGG